MAARHNRSGERSDGQKMTALNEEGERGVSECVQSEIAQGMSDIGFIDDDKALYSRFQRGFTVAQNVASRRPCSPG